VVGVSVAKLDSVQRTRWLEDTEFAIRKATPNKSMRITWVDGKTNLDVSFTAKYPEKTQITIQHNKLPSSEDAEKMKVYWAAMLETLEKYLTA